MGLLIWVIVMVMAMMGCGAADYFNDNGDERTVILAKIVISL